MKIKNIIEQLKRYDEETEVWAYDYNNDCYMETMTVCEDEDNDDIVLIRVNK